MLLDHRYLMSGPLIAIVVLFCIAYMLRAVLRTRNLPTCWHCGAPKVRRSAPQRFLDTLTLILFLKPYRCQGCRVRFYGFRTHRHSAERQLAR
jgi:hypothetical protein